MKRFFKQYLHSLPALFFVAVALVSCNEEDSPVPDVATPQIIFLFSPGGMGDMSYNDCILEGVQQFKTENRSTDIYIYSPESLEEAERIFSDWLVRPGNGVPVLFALASSDYEPMAEKYLTGNTLADGKSVLLFESRKQYDDADIHTFQISTFGASFLAGGTAALCAGDKKALVVLANASDVPIRISCDGFIAGYSRECDVEYLADDWTGYVQAGLTYQKMSTWAKNYGFVFSVAGGSNAGIYRYSREYEDSPFLAGMDIDQSGLSNKITGSVIKHIDRLVYEYLTEWVQTGNMPETRMYGLESGYADWQLAPLFESEYGTAVNELRQQAINKEKEYHEARSN